MITFIKIFLTVFWICDILNMPFMEMFDTTYPLNTLFWILVFIFLSIEYIILDFGIYLLWRYKIWKNNKK